MQSSPWLELTRKHLSSLHESLEIFIDMVVAYIAEESHTRSTLRESIFSVLERMKKDADEELTKLWEDEIRQPVTYNHYYTDNIQSARNDAARKALKNAMDQTTAEDYGGRMHISNSNVEIQRLLVSLQSRIVVNMDDQACNEAREALNAYYKVCRQSIVSQAKANELRSHVRHSWIMFAGRSWNAIF